MKAILVAMCISVPASCFSQELLRPMPAHWKIATLPVSMPVALMPGGAISTQPVPQNFYTTTLGFFCRQELKMQQAHVPVTFRVGSMDECNYLEQKPGYRTLDK